MKKNLLFALLVASITACHNDSTVPTAPNEMPASALVASKLISIYKYNIAYNGAAIGYEFKVKANGYVAGLGCASRAIGNYKLTLFKVDTVNKIGSLIASSSIGITASDTANFKFKYVNLPSKVAITKGNYYRVALNGDFSAYDYLAFPNGSNYSLPLPLPSDAKVVFTKGVAGYTNTYPDSEFTTYLFLADVIIQFP